MNKCQKCNGTGEITVPVEEHMGKVLYGKEQCDECGGTGEINPNEVDRFNAVDVIKVMEMVKEPMTNEEYIRQCSTEQLVHFLIRLCSCGWLTKDKLDVFLNSTYFPVYNMEEIANLEEWLKEKHE